jgi:hypothetical protein
MWIGIIFGGIQIAPFITSHWPLSTTEYHYKVTSPIWFYEKGEQPQYPSVSIWLTFNTNNTIGNMFIAGDKVDASAVLIANNISNIFSYRHSPTFALGFENALIWNQTKKINAVTQNFTINVPALMAFYPTAGNVYQSPCCTPFYWPTEGNYRPVLFIENNDTGTSITLPQNFTSFFISIQPRSVYVTDGYNRVNEALTLALSFFAIVEFARFSWGIVEGKS